MSSGLEREALDALEDAARAGSKPLDAPGEAGLIREAVVESMNQGVVTEDIEPGSKYTTTEFKSERYFENAAFILEVEKPVAGCCAE